ncbi:sensor histidine kinase [Anaerosinus massiliensis]|uniref:sensor histidine kinase n=1 Tax=Massilibacillus massiliensis TaxID=1806837 RepID=UPI000AEB7BDD|nr:sensor histidine kinase [Massilibacillus massiliensis]
MEIQRQLIRSLCLKHTTLSIEDIIILENMAEQLQVIASLTNTDVFIDALSRNKVDSIVLAWAHSVCVPSLYRKSVVGEMAYATQEPAVAQAMSTGKNFYNIRGVSQEGIPIAQTVVPLPSRNGNVIGVLIMEKDISEEIRQEEQVKFLTQTADRLSQTLMSLTTTGCGWEEWVGNGIFVLNAQGKITYANKHATAIIAKLYEGNMIESNLMMILRFNSLETLIEDLTQPKNFQFGDASYLLQAHSLVTGGELSGCVVSVQDVTELRQKEKQLDMQSIIIEEINHRVKNTLQNVISLLRLQMRRSRWKSVKNEFTACIHRVLAIAKVYEVFTYQSRDLVNLYELADYILENIVRSSVLPEQNVKTVVEGQDIFIHASQAVPVALVLNELIFNCLKHGIKDAPSGEIHITIQQLGERINLKILDSGKAGETLLEKFGEKESKLGLYIVRLLICEQLGGTFKLEPYGKFVIADLSFPLYGVVSKP